MSTGSTDVLAPPGCTSISMSSDNSVVKASPSGVLSIPDEYMPEVTASNAVRNGILATGRSFNLGTRRGQRCDPCKRNWNVWNVECPRCGSPTHPIE